MGRRMICVAPACQSIAIEGRPHCPRHAAARDAREAERKQTAKSGALEWTPLYHTARWRDLRSWHLGRNPLCADCAELGGVTAATDVDHIEPHRGDLAKFFDPRNLQSLCKPCHSRKTAAETLNRGVPQNP